MDQVPGDTYYTHRNYSGEYMPNPEHVGGFLQHYNTKTREITYEPIGRNKEIEVKHVYSFNEAELEPDTDNPVKESKWQQVIFTYNAKTRVIQKKAVKAVRKPSAYRPIKEKEVLSIRKIKSRRSEKLSQELQGATALLSLNTSEKRRLRSGSARGE